MNLDTDQQQCLGCDRMFECGIHGREPCWCSVEFPMVMPLPEAAKGCYCRHCLPALIAAARQEKKAT